MTKFLQLLARILAPEKPIAAPQQSDAGAGTITGSNVEQATEMPVRDKDGQLSGPPSPAPSINDFAGITKFRNSRDCRDWPVTSAISDVSVRGGNIYWREDAARDNKWNRASMKGKICNGEALFIIPSRGEAGMFDFLKVGQREKILSNLKPSSHGPGFFPGWTPKKGERVGFLIASISRNAAHAKIKERSNVVWFLWPRDGV